jgi:hypothetical protein
MTNHSGIDRITKNTIHAHSLIVAVRRIESHRGCEEGNGCGDQSAHAARDGEHDEDDAVVGLRHGSGLRRDAGLYCSCNQ